MGEKIKLVCPAGNLPALRAAVDNGADAVYMGFKDGTNARNFPGLNFNHRSAVEGINYAHQAGCQVYLALNTYPTPAQWKNSVDAIESGVELGVDTLIVADMGLMHYVATEHPQIRLHLSVQGSATNYQAIELYRERFGIQRVVLPRVLSVSQVRRIIEETTVEIEVFGFGSLCVMVEGRCMLSSYVTGESPNMAGVCSPAKAVRWEETQKGRQSRLNGVLIDQYETGEHAGYPTLCKGRFQVEDNIYYAIEEPTSLNVLELLPELARMGVAAVKVEGRQRSPAYVAQVTRVMRQAIDICYQDPDHFTLSDEWILQLDKLAEGQCHTLGAYHRSWQ